MEKKMREKVSLDKGDDHILDGDGKNAKTKLKKVTTFSRSI